MRATAPLADVSSWTTQTAPFGLVTYPQVFTDDTGITHMFFRGHGARLGAAANFVSHPLVFLVVAPLLAPHLGPTGALACAEVVAVLVEILVVRVLRRQDLTTAAGTAYVANAVSFCAGVLVLTR